MTSKRHSSRRHVPKQPMTSSRKTQIDPLHDFEGGKIEFFLAKTFYLIRLYSRQVFLGLCVFLICFLVMISYLAWTESREEKSLLAFEELMKEPTMNLSSGAPEIAVEKLQQYAKTFSHTNARIRAMIYQQQYLEKDKKINQAGELCLQLGTIMQTPELKAYFYLKGALFLENAANYQKAEQGYAKAVKYILKENTIQAKALFGQGRMLLMLDKKDEARKILKKLLSFENKNIHSLLTPIVLHLLAAES